MTLGEKILTCRKKLGLSQEVLAEKLGVSRQAVSKWESGEATPEVSKVAAMAQIFGVTTDYLLLEEPAPSQTPPPPPPQQPPQTAAPNWVESIPGVLGKLLRRYGWLFGVYLAATGALFTAFGLVGRAMNSAFEQRTGFSDLMWGVDGYAMVNGQLVPLSQAPATPMEIITGFIIGLGVVLLIAGVVLAIVLHPKKK